MLTSKLLVSKPILAGVLAGTTILALGITSAYRMFRARKSEMPPPSDKKEDPKELDRQLDVGLKDSMAASDPVAATQPEVRVHSL